MRKHIPNIFTSLNLLTGCAGIYYVAEINLRMAALLIFIAAVLDFADGFSARLLKAYSNIGKSLDSLADLVSFGILPGFLLMKLLLNLTVTGNDPDILSSHGVYYYLVILGPLLIPLASAIRLAKFDNDPAQLWNFRGLPTPANAIFIASYVWSASEDIQHISFIYNSHFIFFLTILLSFLLISPLMFLSIKFKSYGFRENFARYLIIAITTASLIIWKVPGIMIGMVCYAIISQFDGIKRK